MIHDRYGYGHRPLTERERQYLRLMAKGWTNDATVGMLHPQVKPKTGWGIRARIFNKYGVSNAIQAIQVAWKKGEISENEED